MTHAMSLGAKRIHMFELNWHPGEFELELPYGARFLQVLPWKGRPMLYVIAPIYEHYAVGDQPTEQRRFLAARTDEKIEYAGDSEVRLTYIGTVTNDRCDLPYEAIHYFERTA
jgi:hypothetical protein